MSTVIASMLVTNSFALTHRQSEWFKQTDINYISKNKGVDQDGAWGKQCVDLVSNYASYIFPVNGSRFDYSKTLGFGNANKLYAGAKEEYFEKILFKDGFVPAMGDVVVWAGRKGRAGHVAIVKSADQKTMTIVHQNGSSRNTKVFEQTITYHSLDKYNGRVIGYLRPRAYKIPITNEEKEIVKKQSKASQISYVKEVKPLNSDPLMPYNTIVELGYLDGSNSSLSTKKLTKTEAVVLAIKFFGLENSVNDMSQEEVELILGNVRDKNQIKNWAKSYIAYAIKEGIISGSSVAKDKKIIVSPNAMVSGEVFSAIIFRKLNHDVNNLDDVYDVYKQMVDGGLSYGAEVLPMKSIDRANAAKIMYDMLKYAYFKAEDGYGIYLRDFLATTSVKDFSKFTDDNTY